MPLLYGLIDDFYNHETHASLSDDVHANAAAIKVGYPHTGAGGLTFQADAAIAANEANGLQVIANLWTTSETFGGQPDPVDYYADRVEEAAARWPDALIESINEPQLGEGTGTRPFGAWTPLSVAQVTAAAVNRVPGRVIGPAIAQWYGPTLDLAWQLEMYDHIFDLCDVDDMVGIGTHIYPNQQFAAEAEVEHHITETYAAGRGLPVYVTECAFQWGYFGTHVNPANEQVAKSVEMWERYYHDPRVGGIFFYRLAENAPEEGGPSAGDTAQRFPLSNAPMETALEEAWGDLPPPPIAEDSSGHSRHGIYENVSGASGAIFGDDGAAEFNGSNSVVTSLYDPWGGPFTLEAWVNTDSTSSRRTIFGSLSGGNQVVMVLGSDVYFVFNGLTLVSWLGAWTGNDVWHHVVLTSTGPGGSAQLYINGAAQGTRSLSAFGATAEIQVGLHSGLHPMDGTIDEVAVYETVLAPNRISVHYYSGAEPNLPPETHPPLGGDVSVVITGGVIGAVDGTAEGLFPPFYPTPDSFPASAVPVTDPPLDGEVEEVATSGVYDQVTTGGIYDQVLTGGVVNENVTGGDVDEVATGGEIIEETVVEDGDEEEAGGLHLPFYPATETYPASPPVTGGLYLPFYPATETYPTTSEETGGLHLPFYPASETFPATGEGAEEEGSGTSAPSTGVNLGGDVEEVVNGGAFDEALTGGDVSEIRNGGEVQEAPTGDSPDESERSGTYDLVLTGGEVL